MTLVQRLEALKAQYAKAKRQHQARNDLAREMSHIMVKLIRRELAQERREVSNAGN